MAGLYDKIVRSTPVRRLLNWAAKQVDNPQGQSDKDIISGFFSGQKSFYNQNTRDGSNELDTYLLGKPYHTEFTGDESVGPQYGKYIDAKFADRKDKIRTYNTHFGDTLYIDNSVRPFIEERIASGGTAGMRGEGMEYRPSYLLNLEADRPYDAGGYLATFSVNGNDTVANLADIYQFDGTAEDYNKPGKGGFIHRQGLKALDRAGVPFIVRQNNVPVKFVQMLPQYKTDMQKRLGEFLALFGNSYDLSIPFKLTDAQIQEIFSAGDSGDDLLNFMKEKGYIQNRKFGGQLNYLEFFKK